GERRLAGAARAGEHDQRAARQIEVDPLQIVLPRVADDDAVFHTRRRSDRDWAFAEMGWYPRAGRRGGLRPPRERARAGGRGRGRRAEWLGRPRVVQHRSRSGEGTRGTAAGTAPSRQARARDSVEGGESPATRSGEARAPRLG